MTSAKRSGSAARLPKGIVQTTTGWRVNIGAAGALRKRFPRSFTLAQVIAEREKLTRSHAAGKAGPLDGSLAADVTRYLHDFYQGRPGYEERQRHLDLWVDALGADTFRASVTRDDIARILNQWRATGLAADTCNKRRTALLALYHALDGKGGSNPVREIPKFRAPDPRARGLDYAKIATALAALPACKTRARLKVLAYTGMRPGQLMRLTAEEWEPKLRLLTVPGTAKGRGTKPYTIPLSQPARDALKELDAIDGWGAFTLAPMDRIWKAAAIKAGLPADCVVYDLRHAFGTATYRATGDIKAVQKLLGHSSLKMTDRYTLAAVPERQQRAVAAFEQAIRPRGKHRGAKVPSRNAHRRHSRQKSRRV